MDDVCERVEIDGGILVGHDGSECAQAALKWAAALAHRAHLDLHVLRAWTMTSAPRPSTWQAGYVPPVTDVETAVLDELRSHVAAAGLPADLKVTCHAVHRAPAKALIEAAEGADLLVVGARGRGGFSGLLLGSIGDQVVNHGPCPVTVVRAGVGRPLAAIAEEAAS